MQFYKNDSGLSEDTPIFPKNWEERAKYVDVEETVLLVHSLEDLALAKYAAGREKDFLYIEIMCQQNLLDIDKMLEFADELPEESQGKKIDIQSIKDRILCDATSKRLQP